MYELNFKHKYGYILRIYEGLPGYNQMLQDISFYEGNFTDTKFSWTYTNPEKGA